MLQKKHFTQFVIYVILTVTVKLSTSQSDSNWAPPIAIANVSKSSLKKHTSGKDIAFFKNKVL